MSTATINLQISMDTLVNTIVALDLNDQRQLMELLQDLIFAGEEALEEDPIVLAEVQASYDAVAAGDFETFQSYLSRRLS
jgi:hypothetical protein